MTYKVITSVHYVTTPTTVYDSGVCLLYKSRVQSASPSLKVDGEWNGVMNSKQPSTGNEECFVDVLALPTIRIVTGYCHLPIQKIKKLSAQDPGESKRKRWLKVSEALARGDESAATDAKHEVGVVREGDSGCGQSIV